METAGQLIFRFSLGNVLISSWYGSLEGWGPVPRCFDEHYASSSAAYPPEKPDWLPDFELFLDDPGMLPCGTSYGSRGGWPPTDAVMMCPPGGQVLQALYGLSDAPAVNSAIAGAFTIVSLARVKGPNSLAL